MLGDLPPLGIDGTDPSLHSETDSEADNFLIERKFFRLSLWYLFLHFGAILAEATLRGYGMGGW